MGSTGIHEHLAHQITISPGARVHVRMRDREAWTSYHAVLIPSGVPHALAVDCHGTWLNIFVGPETAAGRQLSHDSVTGTPHPIELGRAEEDIANILKAHHQGNDGHTVVATRGFVNRLARVQISAGGGDGRVAAALEFIEAHLDENITLSQVAAEVALSASRVRHLLVTQTGAGFRANVRWRRLLRAWSKIQSGSSLSEAALSAGFADASHFSKSALRTFGLKPSLMARALSAEHTG